MTEPLFQNAIDYVEVPKGWGRELWITNNNLYCGKILEIQEGKRLSWHYHIKKDEVIFIDVGHVIFKYGNSDNLQIAEEVELVAGQSVRVPPLLRHQLCAVVDSRILEFSTQHFDEDSVRVIKGD